MKHTWNHKVAKVTGVPEQKQTPYGLHPVCSVSKCDLPQEYFVQYDYVTGKRGRVSSQGRYYCKSHAEKFCKKHNIKIEEVGEISWKVH